MLWLRCRSAEKGRKVRGLAWLYFRPRAGMAELVDAADSKSVALKRRVGSIPSPGTINRLMNFCSNCGTRVVLKVPEGDLLPRHVCENCGDHPLPESEDRRRQRARIRGAHPDLQARHRAAPGVLDHPRRVSWKTTRPSRPGPRAKRGKKPCIDVEIGSLLLVANVTHARQVHVFFRSRMRSAGLRRHPRKPRSEAGGRKGHSLGRPGVSEHRIRAAPLRRRPRRGRRTAPRGARCSAVSSAAFSGQNSAPEKPG